MGIDLVMVWRRADTAPRARVQCYREARHGSQKEAFFEIVSRFGVAGVNFLGKKIYKFEIFDWIESCFESLGFDFMHRMNWELGKLREREEFKRRYEQEA